MLRNFNAAPSTGVSVQSVQRSVTDIGFRRRRQNRLPLLTSQHQTLRYAWARKYPFYTGYGSKRVALSDRSRLQKYQRIDLYGYGDNFMNSWTVHIKR